MTDRLAEIGAHIAGIQQLGAVVNAMRGIAGARAQQARAQLAAVDSYAETIAESIGRILALAPAVADYPTRPTRTALVLFCAEQGFVGAFSERLLDAVGEELRDRQLFLIGKRGRSIAAERQLAVSWSSAMPSHSQGIPKLADQIAEALYTRIAQGEIDRLDVAFADWEPRRGVRIARRRLIPLDLSTFPVVANAAPPLLNLAPEQLLPDLTADYVHARLCNAALHAFAAENEARMEAMAAAHREVERQLSELQAKQRIVRQEGITAEIIELAAGETASLSRKSRTSAEHAL